MLRRRATGSRVATSTSSMRTWPAVASTIRLTILSSVVLPHPDEPTRTVVLRDGMTRLKSSTAVVPSPYVLLTDRYSITSRSPRHDRQPGLAPRHDAAGDVRRVQAERAQGVGCERGRVPLGADDDPAAPGVGLREARVRVRVQPPLEVVALDDE